MTPLFDRVILRPNKQKTTSGGIILPSSITDRATEMVVVALGNECKAGLLVGGGVLVHRYAGTEFPFGDEKLFIVREVDILGKI